MADAAAREPSGVFHVRPELGRRVTFTYFDLERRADVCATLFGCLRVGAAPVVGIHESLPDQAAGFVPWPGARAIYRRQAPK